MRADFLMQEKGGGLSHFPPMTIRILLSTLALFALGAAPSAYAQTEASPRQVQRFDSGWRFHYGDVPPPPSAWKADYADMAWRPVDLPHDFSIEDLPKLAAKPQAALAVTPGAWKFQLGDDPAYKQPGFDDSAWQTVRLPAQWSAHVTPPFTDKIGWYRRRITVPASLRGKDVLLLLGKIDDSDETFVNGVKVGGMGGFPPHYSTAWAMNRRYTVPARLLKGDGTDVVAVRDYNGNGDAGMYAAATTPLRIGPFDAESPGGSSQGYTDGAVAWYSKTFALPAADRGRRVSVTFDGVYMNAQFWLNGHPLGTHPYGYTSFSFDLTRWAHFGGRNVLDVRVDSSGQTSRWYSGSGIYRHVWLTETGSVHIGQWGVYVTTPQVSAARATVRIKTLVQNEDAAARRVTVGTHIVDGRGSTVAAGQVAGTVGGDHAVWLGQPLVVTRPRLWSTTVPTLYRLITTVSIGGKVVDQTETPFGIRSISFDAVHGFLLNGRPLKLRGGCVHHDNGPLGSRTYDRAEFRRVAGLKAAGFNAIRTSHNPPSPAFLDACDRLGLVVMDEAFDCWAYGKNPQDYGRFFKQWWKRDIDSMVQRDRNHPCVVLWSIGNEIPEQATAEGAQRAGMLASEVRAQDPTRGVTEATNPNRDLLDPLLAHLDVTGYNYAHGRFASDHARHPDRVFVQTESFPDDAFGSWMDVRDHPYAAGDFVWTAIDYLGEAGIGRDIYPDESGSYGGAFPYAVSGCGDIDLIGERKPQSYYRGVLWHVGPRVAAFVDAVPAGRPGYRISGWGWPDDRASWTWPGTEGQARTVRVYADTPQVRLLLNGRDLGVKPTTRATHFTATYTVPYAPGTLTAVGLSAAGKEQARWTLQTTGHAAQLRLTPDRRTIAADGEDLSYVTVDLVDAQGRLDPNAAALVHFTLTGPGRIVAVGNADPRSTESYQRPQRRAFRGRCLVILQSAARSGLLRLQARSPGLRPASVTVTSDR